MVNAVVLLVVINTLLLPVLGFEFRTTDASGAVIDEALPAPSPDAIAIGGGGLNMVIAAILMME